MRGCEENAWVSASALRHEYSKEGAGSETVLQEEPHWDG